MKGDQGEDYGRSREEEGDTHTPTHPPPPTHTHTLLSRLNKHDEPLLGSQPAMNTNTTSYEYSK